MDPYANGTEMPPSCTCVVENLEGFEWHDETWMEERKKYADRRPPMSIYETSLPQWKSGQELIEFASEMGYTHVAVSYTHLPLPTILRV